jgi:hypothetical protein
MPRPLRRLSCLILFALLAPLFLVLTSRGDPKPAVEDANVLARFPVAADGDALLLPVTFKGKTYRFLLDTGATCNFFDPSLPVGGAGEAGTLETPAGVTRTLNIAAPEATLGKFSLRTREPATVLDLARIRQVSGSDIRGVVGMAFLRQHVVRLDMDKGEVLFLKSARPAGTDSGEAFPLAYERGSPVVNADLAGWGRAWFCVDTGDVGRATGNLAGPLLDGLVKTGTVEVVGRSLYESAGGTTVERISRAKSLRLGEITISGALFGESQLLSLGLGFLSRFVVTFDFPNDTLYLKKGKRFGQPDCHDRSGLHILRKDGKTVVDSLDKGSPAEAAGFKAGDILVQVGAARAEQTSMFQLRGLFATDAKALQVTVRRGDKDTLLTLDLAPPPPKK